MSANIKTWQERVNWLDDRPAPALMVEAMKAEIADLRAALAAKAVPDGWKLVPIRLTRRMKVASREFAGLYRSESARWNAILAAAPSPAEFSHE